MLPRASPQDAAAAGLGGDSADADRRHYRLADYVPVGVVDISMDVECINDLLLEQVGRTCTRGAWERVGACQPALPMEAWGSDTRAVCLLGVLAALRDQEWFCVAAQAMYESLAQTEAGPERRVPANRSVHAPLACSSNHWVRDAHHPGDLGVF